jgi:integrase
MHARIVVGLMAGVRPEEARAIGWEEDADLGGDSLSVAVLRADRAGETPRPRVPQGAEAGAGGRRGAQAMAGRPGGRAGGGRIALAGHRPGIHHGHRYTAGARHIRKIFQDVCERAGVGRDWAPRDLLHTFVSLLSDDGMAIEKIARLVGHANCGATSLAVCSSPSAPCREASAP